MRTMTSKFAGTCTRCKSRFPAGATIEWAPGEGARHADPAVCRAALAAPRPTAPAPVTAEMDARPILAFLTAAQGRGLKFPKARFLAPDGRSEMRLSIAGAQSKTPGAVHIVIADEWQGRIFPDGRLAGPKVTPALVAALTTIAAAPAIAAKEYAALTSRCSFCGLELTDAGSVEVGYGPICADRYGLPHTAKGTPAALSADALVEDTPADVPVPVDGYWQPGDARRAARSLGLAFEQVLDDVPF